MITLKFARVYVKGKIGAEILRTFALATANLAKYYTLFFWQNITFFGAKYYTIFGGQNIILNIARGPLAEAQLTQGIEYILNQFYIILTK